MLDWSLANELYSFCILLILFIMYALYERGSTHTKKQRLFVKCLLLSMAFITLNIVCVITLSRYDAVPKYVNVILNTLYFGVSIPLVSLYAHMLFEAILEHVYDKRCIRKSNIVLITVTSAAVLLTLVNLVTGWVFYIDENGYNRGPLNRFYYLLLVVELIFLCICYIRNRKSVSDRMIYVIKSVPVIILLICVMQFIYPDILLNGTICAVVSLMIYIAFRSNTDNIDSLTGAGTRKAFVEELALRQGSRQSVELIRVSLLNIADINLRYDHNVGDSVLYEVSHYLRHIAPNAQVFRTGSVTFTVMLPLTSHEEADERLAKIDERIHTVWQLGEIKCHLTAAIAELRCEEIVESPTEIIERIEYTMSLAKKNASLVSFNSDVKAQLDDHSSLVEYIGEAIRERKFSHARHN